GPSVAAGDEGALHPARRGGGAPLDGHFRHLLGAATPPPLTPHQSCRLLKRSAPGPPAGPGSLLKSQSRETGGLRLILVFTARAARPRNPSSAARPRSA